MIVILRLIIVLIILWLALGFLKNMAVKLREILKKRAYGKGGQIADMVKDPVCGSYVAVEHAVRVTKDGVEYYFCSKECSEKYL